MQLHPHETVILIENYDTLIKWYQEVLNFRIVKQFAGGYTYTNLEN